MVAIAAKVFIGFPWKAYVIDTPSEVINLPGKEKMLIFRVDGIFE